MKREDLFIVSKLWNTFHDGDKVGPICKKQLADWGIDYFDLFLIHFPVALEYVDPSVRYPPGWHYDGASEIRPSKASIQETWTAMEALVGNGLAKSIGISNFQGQLVYDLLRYCKIRPATLQIEHHPYLVQQELVNLCKEEGIAVTAYSSFGTLSFAEFGMKHVGALKPLMETDVITSLASKYGKQPSQILLRWSTQRGLAVIPKTSRVNVMATNMDCTSFDIDEEDMAKISAMDKGIRFNQPSNVSPPLQLNHFDVPRPPPCLHPFTDNLVSPPLFLVLRDPKALDLRLRRHGRSLTPLGMHSKLPACTLCHTNSCEAKWDGNLVAKTEQFCHEG